VRKNRFLTRLASGALVAAVAVGGSLLTGGVANAAPPPGTLGTLTITPATGSDTTAPTARTSAPCPTTAQGANLLITGPVGAAAPTFPPDNPYPIVTFTDVSFSTTDPFDLSFELSLKDAAADRGKTLQAGEYDLTAQCVKRLGSGVEGTFTGALFFTSPTAYQTTDPNAGPTATTTVLAVTPASPAAAGTGETLTAKVSPVGAAGSVQFKDGSNNIGSSVPVTNGTAEATTTLPVGTHSLTAVFTPTDSTKFGSSTSNTVPYEVNAPTGAKVTTTTLTAVPSPAFQGLPVFLRANVAPAGAAGTVQFKDGTTALGAPVRVFGGTAYLLTSKLTKGTHSLTAVFTPTNPAAFGPSTSSPVSLTVRSIFGLLQ
jgi:hypothetical protein